MDEASSTYFALVQGLFHVPQNTGQEQPTSAENKEDKEKDSKNKEKSGTCFNHLKSTCLRTTLFFLLFL